jgi:hypothetical protein
MKIAWRKVAVAGVLGFCAGKAAGELRRHPDVVIPILQVSAASGVVGCVVGWGVSMYRRAPPYALSLSLTANFAIASGTFLGIRRVVYSFAENSLSTPPFNDWSPASIGYISSFTSGGITGALASLLSREAVLMQCRRHLDYCSTAGFGLHSILMTSLGGMGMGLCAQAGYDWIQEWRRRKAIEIYREDIQGKRTSLFENWTLENFETRFLGFWHRRAESVAVETEMLCLESAVAEEKRKLENLDRLLMEKGLTAADILELEQSKLQSLCLKAG